jgi:hypothetical protein
MIWIFRDSFGNLERAEKLKNFSGIAKAEERKRAELGP